MSRGDPASPQLEVGRRDRRPEVICTLGYQQRSLRDFIEVARAARVRVIVDVRETAWSHKPGFSKSSFRTALTRAGIEYIHARFAGNPKWLREAARDHSECLSWYDWYLDEYKEVLDALEALVARVTPVSGTIALVCFERHAHDCHRSILAARWAARRARRKVMHLATEGCPRLTAR